MENSDIKKFVNSIFEKKGLPKVKNFPLEFSDGSKLQGLLCPIFKLGLVKFQQLFNILYDENVDCKLEKSNLAEQRTLNWNKINGEISRIFNKTLAQICFNYL